MDEGMNPPLTFHPRHILCPVDFSDLSTLALKYAAAGAQEYGASLTILHGETFQWPPYFTDHGAEQLVREMTAAKEAVREYLVDYVQAVLGPAPGELALRYAVVEAHPVEAILTTAAEEPADLIVLGTHGRSGASRLLLGSVAENVVRQATVPAFTVRQKEHEFIDPSHPAARPRLERILCPVNFTPVAQAALRHAVALAQRFQAHLTVLYSVEAEADRTPAGAHAELCAWVPDPESVQCALEPTVRQGHAAEQIVLHAREERADLIVLGAQHRPFLEATIWGSTTERVLQQAPVPVLVVPRPPTF